MSAITLPSFLEYLRAFNSRSYEPQHAFYSPSITLALPDGTLNGSAAIREHYAKVHARFSEAVVPLEILRNDRHIVLIKQTVFSAREPVPEFCGHKFEKGDVMVLSALILYDFDDEGKIVRAKVNTTGMEFLGGRKSFKEVVSEIKAKAEEEWGCWQDSWENL
ncbi:hypothetical protein GTA08_BOTSDO00704 [Botryosphaeria dothidea]|uniref:SnoaL-like domain-containing protein n=1 Tax=Botryosphaeria dothidea TaxID=55169 RepID=A0A8H4JAX8_9PEZI|nr:hypothetical protein GTA08_BOTSDO00704 [Botryosphaeria dothidea]